MKTLSKILSGALVIASLIGCNGRYSIKGELLDDYIQDKGNGWKFYRIVLQTDKGIITYPIMGDDKELEKLEREFKSRKDTKGKGDIIGIDPETNIFSLDETVLTPNNIKKFTQ